MIFSNGSAQSALEDRGYVRFRPYSAPFIAHMQQMGYRSEQSFPDCQFSYRSKDELLLLLECSRKYNFMCGERLLVSLANKGSEHSSLWLGICQMEYRVKNNDVLGVIVDKLFENHIQPIVNADEEIVGYEFLLRPSSKKRPFSPLELFAIARESGLHSSLDQAARLAAIETSAQHLPRGMKRFINFLPSSIEYPCRSLNDTFKKIEQLALDTRDFVFEVVETERIRHLAHLQHIFEVCRSYGIAMALDDVGAGFSSVEEMSRLQPDYVKIDRSIVSGCRNDAHKQRQIKDIIRRAVDFGGKVLVEGVERREDFEFCLDSGAVLAQGYLFGRPGKP
ncbi:EAL domain-containing protein [Paenibacillus bouchesdurhonensis]|uniref:EAL domain-containing protein n=1 Tax=Paenibacillus bouchesdurhonensis TaxID=1870990 RepID=UPI001901272C|nr:EAL domain-containing protein [Paenibacillus bouchesdurhonensis]